jgi:DNA-directed RNA polymerase subunit RPC12/RpoP
MFSRDYPRCPECGGTVVPRNVLPTAKAPPNTEYLCMACNAPFKRDGTRLVKFQKD